MRTHPALKKRLLQTGGVCLEFHLQKQQNPALPDAPQGDIKNGQKPGSAIAGQVHKHLRGCPRSRPHPCTLGRIIIGSTTPKG